MEYHKSKFLDRQQVLNLYTDANWMAYTKDPEQLMQAIENSLDVVTAWDGDTLVGLIRTIGDGQTILYIQDILVLKTYKRQGIGKQLLQQVLGKYPHIRQKVLLTDDTEETRGFYEAMGFTSCDQGKLVAYAWNS